MSGVRLAVRLPHAWCVADRDAIVEVARLADALDMDVSVQDHLLTDGSVAPCGPQHEGDDRVMFEAHTTLSYVAALTQRSRLIAGVYVLPNRHPVWLAKETASLDALSGGRLVVGVGVGALRGRSADQGQNLGAHRGISVRELDAFGVHGHRGRMMDEHIRVLDAIWTQERARFAGEFTTFEGIDVFPKPVARPRPPIWVGGRSEAAQDRAARLGDAWYPSQPSTDVVSAGRSRIAALATSLGRPVPAIAVNVFVSIDADGERARHAMRAALAQRFDGDAALFSATLAGTPDEVRGRMVAYVEAGVSAFDLKFLPLTRSDTIAGMRLMASEVMPELR
jgi:alkanesulfonate monooxygenase SsuD/methylene tetrahydromethanopterin reductase-like flavin-dependent oxidoreductase (luciferase family)